MKHFQQESRRHVCEYIKICMINSKITTKFSNNNNWFLRDKNYGWQLREIGFSDLLLDSKLKTSQNWYLEYIFTNNENILLQINRQCKPLCFYKYTVYLNFVTVEINKKQGMQNTTSSEMRKNSFRLSVRKTCRSNNNNFSISQFCNISYCNNIIVCFLHSEEKIGDAFI